MDLNRGGFLMLTILQIPSFLCAVYIFLQYTQRTSPLRRLQNHLLMCLLIVAAWTITFELSGTETYLWSGSAIIHTSWFCTLWNTSFLTTATLNRVLMAFMCIERHFLVFRPQLYRTHRSRLLFHYLPLVLVITSILVYITVINLFISCAGVNYNYSRFLCGYTCAVIVRDLATFYAWALVFVPTTITVIGCVLLPIRFIVQKRQLQQVDWQRARKLIVQTSVIAGVYIVCWLPYAIILQLLTNNLLPFSSPDIGRYTAIVPYMTSLLTPFIVFHTIRTHTDVGIMERLKRFFCPQRQGIVQPINNVVTQQRNPFVDAKRPSFKQVKNVKNTVS